MFRVTRLALLAPLLAIQPTAAVAEGEQCVNVRVDMTPTDSLQLVVWLEKADGTYVDTLFITAKTGLYGLGNRPGRFDFNSGPYPDPAKGIDDMWPYGRRINTFPVWAHRHGMTWPQVEFQDGHDDNLSHSVSESSIEATPPYCRPVSKDGDPQCWPVGDKQIWDTGTCATTVHTDKGVFSATQTSLYPPRADIPQQGEDSSDVLLYAAMNPFDAVTHATPKGGEPLAVSWAVPPNLPPGDYVMYAEASKAFDFNNSYNSTLYPGPSDISYAACGEPYRGQPSVVYRVPFTLSESQDVEMTSEYVGYGDVNGETGTLHPPDATITTDTPGSGALRLQLTSDAGNMFRMRVASSPQVDYAAPGTPTSFETQDVDATSATLQFIEPGDDGNVGTVTSYEVRVRANEPITDANFDSSTPVVATVTPGEPGKLATVEVKGLLPETDYYVGVRAYDDCYKASALAITKVTTSDRVAGAVDACFIATAAYGSKMANDVAALRRFRDEALKSTVFGELAVETYYTFGPAAAGVVAESDVLRATARAALHPIIERVKRFKL